MLSNEVNTVFGRLVFTELVAKPGHRNVTGVYPGFYFMSGIELPRPDRRNASGEQELDIPRLINDLRLGGVEAAQARGRLAQLGDLALANLLEQSVFDTKTMLGQQITLEHALDALLGDSTDAHGMFIATDLVGFGSINKIYGQETGDEILTRAAAALTASIRTSQTPYADGLYQIVNRNYESDAYRIGGDEFAALLRSDAPFSSVNPTAVLLDKLRGVIENADLQEVLNRLGVNSFGIRGSVVIIDRFVHHGYKDVIADADPKLKTMVTCMLVRNNYGVLEQVEQLVDKHE